MRDEIAFKKGAYVFIENDEDSRTVYLVKTGRVVHLCQSPHLASALKEARDGDFFGFISAFSKKPRLSSAVAAEDTVAVEFDRAEFLVMLWENPEIAVKIMNSFSHSLLHYDNFLMDLKPAPLLESPSQPLRQLGEYYFKKGDTVLARYIFHRFVQTFPDAERLSEIEERLETLGPAPAERLISSTETGELVCADRAVIFCEHEPGDNLYLIKEGQVKILKRGRDREILLAVLGEGEIFGELALLTNAPRSATAVAFGGARLQPLDLDLFLELISRSHDLVKKIISSISQRLWFNHVRLSHMSYQSPVTRLLAFLESKLVEDGVSLKSETAHQFQFGLEELVDMNELSAENHQAEIDTVIANRNLAFSFGKLSVLNPKEFTSSVEYYKKRDKYSLSRGREPSPNQSPEVDPNLLEESHSASPEPVEPASRDSGPESDVLDELQDEDPAVRSGAVAKAMSYGAAGRGFLFLLKARLQDPLKSIRRSAARAIVAILPPGQGFGFFQELLENQDSELRGSAVLGLGELSLADNSAIVALLVKACQDPVPIVRINAVRALLNYGADARRALPTLIGLLKDRNSSVRILAITALGKLSHGGQALNDAMEGLRSVAAQDQERYVKSTAQDVLAQLVRLQKLRR